jgi:hypothetical protein
VISSVLTTADFYHVLLTRGPWLSPPCDHSSGIGNGASRTVRDTARILLYPYRSKLSSIPRCSLRVSLIKMFTADIQKPSIPILALLLVVSPQSGHIQSKLTRAGRVCDFKDLLQYLFASPALVPGPLPRSSNFDRIPAAAFERIQSSLDTKPT